MPPSPDIALTIESLWIAWFGTIGAVGCAEYRARSSNDGIPCRGAGESQANNRCQGFKVQPAGYQREVVGFQV